jgi:hypothetical protein
MGIHEGVVGRVSLCAPRLETGDIFSLKRRAGTDAPYLGPRKMFRLRGFATICLNRDMSPRGACLYSAVHIPQSAFKSRVLLFLCAQRLFVAFHGFTEPLHPIE